MSAPTDVKPLCECGHTWMDHDEMDPSDSDYEMYCGDGCECGMYRATDRLPAYAKQHELAGYEALIATGRRSPTKRTVSLTEKIIDLLNDLRERVREEEGQVEALREIADLERQLTAARAKLRAKLGVTPTVKAVSPDSDAKPCPDCDRAFGTNQAVGVHRAKVHGYRRAVA